MDRMVRLARFTDLIPPICDEIGIELPAGSVPH
jgi:hypothetical protein